VLPFNHTFKFDAAMRDRVIAWLAENVPESRLSHVLRVETMAVELAGYYKLNVEKAACSGLMHDLAKYFKPQHLLDMARLEGLELDPLLEANPHLLHAEVSAIVARDTFGIRDEEVLQAIGNHTLGRPGMDALSCIMFLADGLEPGRGNTSKLEALRQVSYRNLDEAVWLTCDYSIEHLIETHRSIHPRTVATRNDFLQKAKHKELQASSKA
jgi:predicted HD superfamily hydrolase involved in NAD metabolism